MAGNLEQYRKAFRESQVAEQETLLGIHILFYAAVNTLWVILNMVFMPRKFRWLTFYPIVVWGMVIFAHWWFFVRKAGTFCALREEQAEEEMKGQGSSISVE